MATRVSHFWKALESVVGGSAVSAEWASWLRGDLAWAQAARLLRPAGELSRTYPRDDADPSMQPYHVVEHGEDEFVGVCPDGWDPVPLTREQLILWELDVRRLAAAAGAALGISPALEPDVLPFTSRVGVYAGAAGAQIPAYLTIGIERPHLTSAAMAVATLHEPCLLLAPTRGLLADDCRTLMRARRACFVCLDEILAVDDGGRLVALRSLAQLLSEQRCLSAAAAPRADGCYPPRTVVWQGVEHDCALSKLQMGFLLIGLASPEIDVHRLMDRRSGVVWKRKYIANKETRDLISQFVSRLNAALLNATPALRISFSLKRDADLVCRYDPPVAPLTLR